MRLLYVGRLEEFKGMRLLMATFEELQRRGNAVELRVVGGGSMSDELERWAAGWPGAVTVQPFVQTRELPPIMHEADLLLFPTTGDPYGLVVDEALYAGLPVLSASKAGEIRERLEDTGAGIVSDALEEWVTNIEGLIALPQRLDDMAEAGRKYASTRSLERWVSEIDDMARLIETSPGRPVLGRRRKPRSG
jgi:glycosyltransferase involved in cell wall biosynthesis